MAMNKLNRKFKIHVLDLRIEWLLAFGFGLWLFTKYV